MCLCRTRRQIMRTKTIAIMLAAMFTSCVFDNKDTQASSSSAKTAITSSTSVQTNPQSRLTMALNKLGLKRVSVDVVDNKVVDRKIDTLPDSTIQETVVVSWGEIQKENYSLTYYLFSTGSPVLVDSVTVSDSLTYINKEMRGNVITKDLGFTGEGMMPVIMINDSLKVGGVSYVRKRFIEHVEDTIDIVVYGTDSLNVHSSVKIRIAYSQNPYYILQNYILDSDQVNARLSWNYHFIYVEKMHLPYVKWCNAYDLTKIIDSNASISYKYSNQFIGITDGKTTDITKDMLFCAFNPKTEDLSNIYINDIKSVLLPIDQKIYDSINKIVTTERDSISKAEKAKASLKVKVDTIEAYGNNKTINNNIKVDTTTIQDIQIDVQIKDTLI